MPLLITPYTLGTELPAAPADAGGGAWYVARRRKWMAMAFLFLLMVLA